ncbi:transposase [Streptomyces sp. NPDC008086]|uniref:transposase n=1 Tax=Streptomyces sp. NPDC008086 TaxID=3364807 RepID=UPI0036E29485
MLTYAAARVRTFFDWRLYLMGSWTRDRERCRAAGGVPDSGAFATKPQLGIAMLTGAEAGPLPFSWVAADADYGKDLALMSWLHEREDLLRARGAGHPAADRSAGQAVPPEGRRGRWPAALRHGAREVEAPQPGRGLQGTAHLRLDLVRGLPARPDAGRRLRRPAADTPQHRQESHWPAAASTTSTRTSSSAPPRPARSHRGDRERRGPLEDRGEQRTRLRRWTSWHRHVTCAMLALAFQTIQRARHPDPEPAAADLPGQPVGLDPADEGKAQVTA